MSVFTPARHPSCSPFVRFSLLPHPLNLRPWEWPARETYAAGIFLELGSDLLDTVAALSKERLPWEVYELTEITGPDDLLRHSVAVDCLLGEIASTPADKRLADDAEYIYANGSVPPEERTGKQLKVDLIDTLTLRKDTARHAALTGQTLCIVGY